MIMHDFLISDLEQRTAKAKVADPVRANFVRLELLKAVGGRRGVDFQAHAGFQAQRRRSHGSSRRESQ